MIEKVSGRVAYAVMSFGGFLASARATIRCRGRPSSTTPLGGYVTGITESQLSGGMPPAPESLWGDRAWETRVHEHYKAPVYWDERAASQTF